MPSTAATGCPREFIGERDAVAKQLRADGRRDEAAAVKALGKPTVAAWAANQAVRSRRSPPATCGRPAISCRPHTTRSWPARARGAKLREATERERAAVERLVDAARGLLSAWGGDLSEATIERVRETLHAGAIDSDAREEVAAAAPRASAPRRVSSAARTSSRHRRPSRPPRPRPEPKAERKAKGKAKPGRRRRGAQARARGGRRAQARGGRGAQARARAGRRARARAQGRDGAGGQAPRPRPGPGAHGQGRRAPR